MYIDYFCFQDACKDAEKSLKAFTTNGGLGINVIEQCAANPAAEHKKNVEHHSKTQANCHPETNKGVFM